MEPHERAELLASIERDFAAGVLVRLVDRMLDAEAKLAREQEREKANATLWTELGDLLRDEPEYQEELAKNGGTFVAFLPVAIRVLRRLGLRA